jgi:hypothetical protein
MGIQREDKRVFEHLPLRNTVHLKKAIPPYFFDLPDKEETTREPIHKATEAILLYCT